MKKQPADLVRRPALMQANVVP